MDILTVDYNSKHGGEELALSLHNTGFAIMKNHPIDTSLVEKIYSEWRDFFNSSCKNQYPYNKKLGDGYVSLQLSEKAKGSNLADLKEFYQLYFPHGRYPKELSDNTMIYFNNIFSFANKLLSWLDLYTPKRITNLFSEPLANMTSRERTMLRILHYPKLIDCHNNLEGAIRAAAHEDINLITLLPASTQTGLQVKTKKNTWLDVGTNPGEIIVNVGDMLQECSDHYYVSTTHRVVNPQNTNEERFSMPLFVHPRSNVFLSKKYNQAEYYLNERLKELGLLD